MFSLNWIQEIQFEYCFNIELRVGHDTMPIGEKERLHWLLAETFEPELTTDSTSLHVARGDARSFIVEVGPRMAFR